MKTPRLRALHMFQQQQNVGHFKNMRRECQVKSFDGLGPFSYVCRMMRFSEPNPNEFELEGIQFILRNVFEINTMVRTFLMMVIMTVDMFPLHLQSQIRGSDRGQAPKRPRDVADGELHQVLVIRTIRMIRMEIRTIRTNGTSPNWRETFCFSTFFFWRCRARLKL